ncbi:aminotransferase [Sphingomonas flavalba]|uniref:aminotransferase n=1 Tax=Sphingomonas flavalba TaxID=2559804 RepID=UPI00109DC758|nr:aminotransferase [Sphingomonas flavalba]
MNPIYAAMPTTIFETMSGLARELGAINLGQGFPDSTGPGDVVDAASRALFTQSNQYPPMAGLPVLRQAVADHYARHQGLDLSWADEVTVTSGATEAIAAAILALVTPGDEVVLIEPAYDAYLPLVLRAGGVPRFVRLAPPDWRLTAEALDAAFGPKTRVAILNNPLNPTATMFAAADLALLAERVVRHDAVLIADEVWEHVVFDGRPHLTAMALPGMRERTVKIGSGGKIFALTGWKVGWMCAAPALTRVVAKAHQFLTFTTAPNLQAGVAHGLGKDERYFTTMRADLARSRDRLTNGLEAAGWRTQPSAGTYFLSVDLAASGIALDDTAFCDRLVREAGVAAIPVSAFYHADPVDTVVRLCFAKNDETLDQAIERMAQARALF